jgi:hypothetical protein
MTYGEETSGVGASQSWTGEDGRGELTLTKCDPETGIAYDMVFVADGERVPASVTMSYTTLQEGMTRVTWNMKGSWEGAVPPIFSGWMKILTPWMIGGQFERGLKKLKMRAESWKG